MTKGTSVWQALLLGAALLAVSATGLAATMYKWTDSEGNVQYTQTPPPKGSYQELAPSRTAPPAQQESDNGAPAAAREDKVPAMEAERQKLEAEVARHNCEAARNNLEIYTMTRRVLDEKGEVIMLSDEDRAAKIEEASDAIKKYCR